jgi:quercetin dioxygenase-like cupin family protein
MSSVFSGEEGERADRVVFKWANALKNHVTEALATNLKGQHLCPLLVRLEPRQKVPAALCFHPGDEFVYCLSGQIECDVGEQKIILTSGNAITYKGVMPHRMKNVAPTGSEALLVFELGRQHAHYHSL